MVVISECFNNITRRGIVTKMGALWLCKTIWSMTTIAAKEKALFFGMVHMSMVQGMGEPEEELQGHFFPLEKESQGGSYL